MVVEKVIFGFKLLFLLAILPLFLLYRVSGLGNLIHNKREERFKLVFLKPKSIQSVISRLLIAIAISLTLLPVWIGGYFVTGYFISYQLGYISVSISITGKGSMYPTFPKGQGKDPKELSKQVVGSSGMFPYPNGFVILGKRYFGHQITRGDIVIVEDDKTREITQKIYGDPSGWIKRIIGVAGDRIELKEGIVYLNNEPLAEPYTAKPRSTFGETFLKECQRVTVPENSIFVMGDNRKGSGDSREVGFLSIDSIKKVLPLTRQKGDLAKNWRDTSKDFDESSKIKLNKEQYLELLNEKRNEAGAKPLKYQAKLELSAQKRGEIILKYDDFSFEATKSGYTMSKAMKEANYSNIVWGEAPTLGYYESEELIENQFEFPDSKKFFLERDYQEIGISEVEGTLNGCPTQIIVQHFAGYVPPNYKQSDIDSWVQSINKLRETLPSWESVITDNPQGYEKHKGDYDRHNEIMRIRISRMERIVFRMKANQWLAQEEQGFIDQDQALYNEQETLAAKLNSSN